MLQEVPATGFVAWKQKLESHFGSYLSRQVDQVTQAEEFYVVNYQAKFEKANQVAVSVAFHADHSIAFLSFDSEGFSWSTFQSKR